jgi:hypothetical protein
MANTRTTRQSNTTHSSQSANDKRNEHEWKVVSYERDMFFSTLSILKNRNPVVEANRVLKNAVIESAIIHARNLCCIFLSVPSRVSDDILLRELTLGWKRDAGRDKLITLLEKAFFKDPVNGAIVFDAFSKRVTYAVDRRADADSYDYAAEFVAINGLIKAIVENLEATLDARSSLDQ